VLDFCAIGSVLHEGHLLGAVVGFDCVCGSSGLKVGGDEEDAEDGIARGGLQDIGVESARE